MENKKDLFQDEAFLSWLHELTVLGYEAEYPFTISTDHMTVIQLFYKEGKAPAAALAEYIEFLTRWNALQKFSY